MKRYPILLLTTFCLLSLPQFAWANGVSPLFMAALDHMVFGNALIGLLEGLLLIWLYGFPRIKTVPVMIVANYASALVGWLFLQYINVESLPVDIANGWMWFWILVGATYCLTIVVEWLFIIEGFRGKPNRLKRSLRASVVVQSISYIFLFGWYWNASNLSLFTKMSIVDPGELSLPESVAVYYISTTDGNVYRRGLTDGGSRKIYDLHSTSVWDRLFVQPSATDANRWNLMALMDTEDNNETFVELLTNLLFELSPNWSISDYAERSSTAGEVIELGTEKKSQWIFRMGRSGAGWGLRGENMTSGEEVSFSYDSLFGLWRVQNAVLLPTDKVLFQLGEDQICGFDPVARRVALLWHGRRPIAVIEKEMSNRTVP